MRITLRQLEIFHSVCQEGTITGAARRIGLSQAATSQAIAELENLLERTLFDRKGKRIVLNSSGRQLLPSAVEVLDRIGAIEGQASQPRPRLRLIASLTVGDYLLPPIIARFHQLHAAYSIQLLIRNTEEVVNSVLRFESDAGWIEGFVQDPDLHSTVWADDELVFVASPRHPLANLRPTTKQFSEALWVLRERGSGTRAAFENAIAGTFQVRNLIELGGIEAVKRAVIAGAGLGCISMSAVESELKARQLTLIRSPINLKRQIVLLTHRSRYLDPSLKTFLEFSKSAALPGGQ
jgi:molybdate transport repressor ModE-like protein